MLFSVVEIYKFSYISNCFIQNFQVIFKFQYAFLLTFMISWFSLIILVWRMISMISETKKFLKLCFKNLVLKFRWCLNDTRKEISFRLKKNLFTYVFIAGEVNWNSFLFWSIDPLSLFLWNGHMRKCFLSDQLISG